MLPRVIKAIKEKKNEFDGMIEIPNRVGPVWVFFVVVVASLVSRRVLQFLPANIYCEKFQTYSKAEIVLQ